jgi:hypothetical protein
MPTLRSRPLIAVIALVAALTACAAAEVLLGLAFRRSPGAANDNLRLSHLSEVTGWITTYYLESSDSPAGRKLPRTLDEAARSAGVGPKDEALFLADPATHQPITYRADAGTSYELGTSFETNATYPRFPVWNHAAGPRWFHLDATSSRSSPPQRNYWWNGC